MTEESRRKNRKIAVSRAGVKKQSGPKGTAKRAGFIKKEGLKKKEQEIKIEKWSFGNMFRIFLIICIIATILLSRRQSNRTSEKIHEVTASVFFKGPKPEIIFLTLSQIFLKGRDLR